MRAVVQRVSHASVAVDDAVCGEIGSGLLVLLAVESSDTDDDIAWLSGKLVRLRVFDDDAGTMNRSVQDIRGGILVVSQFTLFASTRKGNRPSYIRSAPPEIARPMVQRFVQRLEADLGRPIAQGRFGAEMKVSLLNDGPVTLIVDSRLRE